MLDPFEALRSSLPGRKTVRLSRLKELDRDQEVALQPDEARRLYELTSSQLRFLKLPGLVLTIVLGLAPIVAIEFLVEGSLERATATGVVAALFGLSVVPSARRRAARLRSRAMDSLGDADSGSS